jgi:hypothetical protein
MSTLRKYKFLFKPAFFIFNLFFSTWLVFQIEKIRPSDFGRYRYWFELPDKASIEAARKKHIKKLCDDYKAGLLDSTQFQLQLDKVISRPD